MLYILGGFGEEEKSDMLENKFEEKMLNHTICLRHHMAMMPMN